MNQPKFWVGCFQQPKESFQKFAAEGVNLVVQPAQSNGDTALQRRAAAKAAGMFYADVPESIADIENMMEDACAFIAVTDEPSEFQPWISDPKSQAFVDAFVAKWKPIFDAVRGRKPIFCNFGSDRILSGEPTWKGEMVLPYVKACSVTQLSFDDYPINGTGALSTYNSQAYNGGIDPHITIGDNSQQFTFKVLQSWCPGMPIMAYVETTKINPSNPRGPTGAEIQAEVDALLKVGVNGIIYFTHAFGNGTGWDPTAPAGGSMWDGRGAEQVAACKAINAKLNPSQPVPSDLQAQLNALSLRVAALEKNSVKDIQVIR